MLTDTSEINLMVPFRQDDWVLMKHLMAYEVEPIRESSVIKSDAWLRAIIGKLEIELQSFDAAKLSVLIAVLLAQVRPPQYAAIRQCPKLCLKRRRGPLARAPPRISVNDH